MCAFIERRTNVFAVILQTENTHITSSWTDPVTNTVYNHDPHILIKHICMNLYNRFSKARLELDECWSASVLAWRDFNSLLLFWTWGERFKHDSWRSTKSVFCDFQPSDVRNIPACPRSSLNAWVCLLTLLLETRKQMLVWRHRCSKVYYLGRW